MTRRGRAKDPEALAAALAEVYAQVPSTNCQGLCADSCCSFAMTRVEQRNIHVQTGVQLPLAHAGSYCPALTMFRQCGVYAVRPLICRIWGTVASMRCNFGCVPEGGFLTDLDAMRLLARVHELSGNDRAATEYRAVLAADPEMVGRFMRSQQKERDLAHRADVSRPGAIVIAGPGKLAKKPPR